MPPKPSDSSSSPAPNQPETAPFQIEEQYRSIFENAPDGIFQTNPEGKYLRVNPSLAIIYGYSSPEELMMAQPNFSGQLYVEPTRRDVFVQLMAQQDVIKDFESQIYRRDGSTLWISETCRAVRDAQGSVLYYEGFVRDISDRKHIEAERAQVQAEREQTVEALNSSKARTRTILSAIPDLMFQVNRAGIYTDYLKTSKFTDLLANTAYLVGRHLLEVLPPDIAQRQLEYLHQAFETGQNQIYEQQITIDGTLQYEEVRVVVSGENEALFMIRDISDRKRSEAERQQAEQELVQKNQELEDTLTQLQRAKQAAEVASQAKSAFLANMSHELRTPLNGILGYTQILMRDRNITPKQQEGIRTIHQCGSHLLTLINDILDLSKIEAQKLELTTQELLLEAFLEDVASICRIRAEQKRLAFLYEIKGSMPDIVQADEKRLRQIVLNLLSNAIKFTDRGQVTFRVTGTPHQAVESPFLPTVPHPIPYTLQFEITDSGVGIAPDQVERIFQPFEQVGEQARQVEGTGLGLAITQRLITLMGGDLRVESEFGVGSRFWFEIRLMGYLGAIAPPPPSSDQTIIGYEGKRQTILVVDDRQDNRSVVLGLLEPLGFQLIEARNGLEGSERAIEHQPDLIIADLVMPVMDGFEMTRRLRSMEIFQATPIIASSASVFEFDRQKSREAGYDDFLPKPIQTEELFHRLEIYLNLVWICDQNSEERIEEALDQSEMVIPVVEELLALYEAAQIGHIERIIQEATRLQSLHSSYAVFAKRVLSLADQFDDVEIIKLIEPHLSPA